MFRTFLMTAVLATVAMVNYADAGMRGGKFTGSLGDGIDGELNFALVGNALSGQSGPVNFSGTYLETDLLIVSFWTGYVTSPDDFQIVGIGFFGFVTILVSENNAIFFRDGPAEIE